MDILDRDMFDPPPNTPEHASWTMALLARLDRALGLGALERPIFALDENQQQRLSPRGVYLMILTSTQYSSTNLIRTKRSRVAKHADRTRDKMSAARKTGKWVGGCSVLGYDVDQCGGPLVVNEEKGERIRAIFALFEQHSYRPSQRWPRSSGGLVAEELDPQDRRATRADGSPSRPRDGY